MLLDSWLKNKIFTNAIAKLLFYKKIRQQKRFNIAF